MAWSLNEVDVALGPVQCRVDVREWSLPIEDDAERIRSLSNGKIFIKVASSGQWFRLSADRQEPIQYCDGGILAFLRGRARFNGRFYFGKDDNGLLWCFEQASVQKVTFFATEKLATHWAY